MVEKATMLVLDVLLLANCGDDVDVDVDDAAVVAAVADIDTVRDVLLDRL